MYTILLWQKVFCSVSRIEVYSPEFPLSSAINWKFEEGILLVWGASKFNFGPTSTTSGSSEFPTSGTKFSRNDTSTSLSNSDYTVLWPGNK